MSLSAILEKIGPCLSSKLAAEICKVEHITAAAARKRIERAKANREIYAVAGIRFRHNEQFVYLKSQATTEIMQKSLFSALLESNSIYRLPLLGIAARGGMISNGLYPTFAGLPLTARDGRQNCRSALTHLKNAELLVQNDQTGRIYLSSQFAPNTVSEARRHSRSIAETILLLAIRDWCQLQGFFSKDKFSIRDDDKEPQFGFFQWDLVGPSYIAPLATYLSSEAHPGFIVADVILGRQLSLADVGYFIHKVKSVRANPNNRPFLAILFAEWFDIQALHEGRKNGILFTTPKNFFGKPFGELLDDIIQAFENKETFLEAEPDYLHKVISSIRTISHLQEAASNANQQLFKLLVGFCYSTIHGGNAVFDIMLDRTQLADVFIETKRSLTVCEVKWQADQKALKAESLASWLTSLPALCASLRAWSKQPAELIVCTNRTFSEEARQMLDKAAMSFPLSYIDGPSLRDMINALDPALQQLIPTFALDGKIDTESWDR